ncbi:MAG: hypothetical protein V4478_00165 [Patescibacteria group bacterium]
MENNKIKPIPVIITIVALVAFAAVLIAAKKQQATEVAQVPEAQESSLCYVLNKKTASSSNDVAYLKLTSADGGKTVTGELATYLAEKDGMSGTLNGTVRSDNGIAVFDGTYANAAEGMNNVDQRIIRLDDTQAQVGYGETIKNADGTYSYKDASALNYSLSIPAVDCAEYSSLKTAAGH